MSTEEANDRLAERLKRLKPEPFLISAESIIAAAAAESQGKTIVPDQLVPNQLASAQLATAQPVYGWNWISLTAACLSGVMVGSLATAAWLAPGDSTAERVQTSTSTVAPSIPKPIFQGMDAAEVPDVTKSFAETQSANAKAISEKANSPKAQRAKDSRETAYVLSSVWTNVRLAVRDLQNRDSLSSHSRSDQEVLSATEPVNFDYPIVNDRAAPLTPNPDRLLRELLEHS